MAVDIKLNSILGLTDNEMSNSKIEFNMNVGSGGEPYIDMWLKYSEDSEQSGTCWDCSYLGWYGKAQRNFFQINGYSIL